MIIHHYTKLEKKKKKRRKKVELFKRYCLDKFGHMDRMKDRQTDGQSDSNIPLPSQLCGGGGIIKRNANGVLVPTFWIILALASERNVN